MGCAVLFAHYSPFAVVYVLMFAHYSQCTNVLLFTCQCLHTIVSVLRSYCLRTLICFTKRTTKECPLAVPLRNSGLAANTKLYCPSSQR